MAPVNKKRRKESNLEEWRDLPTLEYSTEIDGWRLKGKIENFEHEKINIEDELEDILTQCEGSLKNLDIRSLSFDCFKTPIILAAKLCPNVQNVYTSEFLWLTTMELYAIIQNWINLERLTISLIHKNNESCVAKLLFTTRNLKYFAIKNHIYTNSLNGIFLKDLPIRTIEEINFTRCVGLKSPLLCKILIKLQKLRALTLKSCNIIDDFTIKTIAKKKTLKKLYIDDIPITNANVFSRRIITLEYLEELSIPNNSWLTDQFLIKLSYCCKRIKSLNINLCFGITNKGISSLVNLKQLEILKMNYVFRVDDEPFGFLTNLKVLKCYGCDKIKDNGIIRLIEQSPYLTELNLSQCSITNKTIETAIDVTNRRQNIVLELNIFNTDTNLSELFPLEISPLLRIVDVDVIYKPKFYKG